MSFPRAAALTALLFFAVAAEAAERHRIDVPAGRLGDAVAALGRQARISIGFSDSALANERVRGVRGRMTIEQALQRLLSGTRARPVMVDPTIVRIVRRPRPPAPPPAARPVEAEPAPAPPSQPSEIIVTASRRSAPLRSYPGSVMVVDGRDPALAGVRGSDALVARLPGLTSTHLGPGRNKLFARGISESSFNGPTQAIVGQYLGESRLNYNAPDPDLRLHDIERIELLAGPQGTLYGAGSLGGIIRVVPNPPRPDRLEAAVAGGLSVTAHGEPGADAAALLNLPMADGEAALRIGLYAVSEGGYIDDSLRGRDDVNRIRVAGGKIAGRSLLGNGWAVDLGAVGQRIRGADAQFAEAGQPRLTRRSFVTQDFSNDYLMGRLVAARQWDDYHLVVSGSWVRQALDERYDVTRQGNPPGAYDLDTEVTLVTGEARLSRKAGGGTGWVAGASLLRNGLQQSREVDLLVSPPQLRNRVENDIVEGSIYGEAAIRVTPRATATLGSRINLARLTNSGFAINPGFPLPPAPVEQSRSSARLLPAGALSVRLSRDLMAYGRYQQSYRPGGASVFLDQLNRFRSDKVGSLEAGLRYGSPGVGRFDLAAAIAYTRWTDVQADTLDIFGEPSTANIGDARIYTLDLSLGWRPLPALAIEVAAVVNDSELTRLEAGIGGPDPSPPLPGIARFNGRIAAHYNVAATSRMDLRLSAAARYTGKSLLGVGDFLAKEQGDWLDVSLNLEADLGRHSLFLSATNLFDSDASRFALGSPFTLDQRDFTTPVRPRTVRVGWESRF